jgi:hypothetical protein
MRDLIETSLKRFFKARSKTRDRRRWGCLDESEIAACRDHRMDSREKDRVEAHLAECDFCLGQVAFLAKMDRVPIPESIPELWLSRAQELVRPRSRLGFGWAWRWEAVAATVAGLAVVVALSLRNPVREVPTVRPPAAVTPTTQAPSQAAPELPSQPAPPPTVRRAIPQISAPTLIFPRPNTTLSGGPIEFRWEGVRNTLYYEVQLVTADGDLVWESRTEGNVASLPANLSLSAGQKYFVWVQAFLAEGKTKKSTAVAFTVAARD